MDLKDIHLYSKYGIFKIGTYFFLLNIKNFTGKKFRDHLNLVLCDRPFGSNYIDYFGIQHEMDFLYNNVSLEKAHNTNIKRISNKIKLKESFMLPDNHINNISIMLEIDTLKSEQQSIEIKLKPLNYEECLKKINTIQNKTNVLNKYLSSHDFFKINDDLYIDQKVFCDKNKIELYMTKLIDKLIHLSEDLLSSCFDDDYFNKSNNKTINIDNGSVDICEVYSKRIHTEDWYNLYKDEFKRCIYAFYILGHHFEHIKTFMNEHIKTFVDREITLKLFNTIANIKRETSGVTYLPENLKESFLNCFGLLPKYNIYGKKITMITIIDNQYKINKLVNKHIRSYFKINPTSNIDYFEFIFYEE